MSKSLLRRHMPELDFWRGVAIASVLIYHAIYWSQSTQSNHVEDLITRATVFGWLGVNLFFVLSGFLITGILLDAKGKPGYFRTFYGRRVRRIVPAFLLCLALLVLFRDISAGGLLQAVTFTANYNLIPAAHSFAPLWSLSVEEQFYLVWPLLVLLTSRRALTCICVAICLLEPLLRGAACLYGGAQYQGLIIHGTLFVADSLALGALGALYFRSQWAGKRSVTLLSASLTLAAGVLFVIGYPHGLLHRVNPWGAALQVVPFDLFFAAVIFASVGRKPALFSMAITKPVRALGDISYGLYLYHLIFFGIYDHLFPNVSYRDHFGLLLVRGLISCTAATAFAWISRWKFEEIFLRKNSVQPLQPSGIAASTVVLRNQFAGEERAVAIGAQCQRDEA